MFDRPVVLRHPFGVTFQFLTPSIKKHLGPRALVQVQQHRKEHEGKVWARDSNSIVLILWLGKQDQRTAKRHWVVGSFWLELSFLFFSKPFLGKTWKHPSWLTTFWLVLGFSFHQAASGGDRSLDAEAPNGEASRRGVGGRNLHGFWPGGVRSEGVEGKPGVGCGGISTPRVSRPRFLLDEYVRKSI